MDDSALKNLKADSGALRQAYLDAGGKPSQHDSNHNPCPFCGDDSGLSLFEKDGQARWKCWSKCGGSGGTIVDFVMAWQKLGSKDAIKAALQKYGRQTPSQSAPARANNGGGCVGSGSRGEASGGVQNQNKGKLHLSVDEAIGANIWRMQQDPKNAEIKATKYWHYTDERGEPQFVVVRYDLLRKGEAKKEFSPIRRDGNGWRLGLGPWGKAAQKLPDGTVIPAKLCPLYGLPLLVQADQKVLHVVEGEKCADALRALGLTATTSQGGAGRPYETDWKPAASFAEVTLWQDIDPVPPPEKADRRTAGEKYTQGVAELISHTAQERRVPCPPITIVDLRGFGLVEGQDVYDLLQTLEQDGKDQEAALATLAAAAKAGGRIWLPPLPESALTFGNQPKPLPVAPVGLDKRADLSNYVLFEREKKNPKKDEASTEWVPRALTIDVIRARVLEVTGGWPCRVRAPGAKQPLLFVDNGEPAVLASGGAAPVAESKPVASAEAEDGEKIENNDTLFSKLLPVPITPDRIDWLGCVERFRSWLHDRGRPKFRDKLDAEGSNFVSFGDMYQHFGGCRNVSEYRAVESRPHWPPIPGHFYAWSAPKYVPTGERLRKLLSFFENCQDRVSVAVLAAAVLTPGWGGPYGKRPCLVVSAPDRGYGKSTIAECCAKIWGGHLSINLSQRDEDELLQRLLTPEALTKRVGIIDNVKGTLSNPLLEGLITSEIISGKRLYSGEACRPNCMTYFVTANGVRLSRDMSTRAFFIRLKKPAQNANWDAALADFVSTHGREVIADVVLVLSSPLTMPCSINDRWALWVREVLTRACAFVGGVTPDEVMQATLSERDDCDDDLEEAQMLVDGLVEHLSKRFIEWNQTCNCEEVTFPKDPIFITSTEMKDLWNTIMGKKLSSKAINQIIREHLEAGRLKALTYVQKNYANGYELSEKVMTEYLKKRQEKA